jgi:hypothetical protein
MCVININSVAKENNNICIILITICLVIHLKGNQSFYQTIYYLILTNLLSIINHYLISTII